MKYLLTFQSKQLVQSMQGVDAPNRDCRPRDRRKGGLSKSKYNFYGNRLKF